MTKENGKDTEKRVSNRRYNSLVLATEELNKKYIRSLEANELLTKQLTGAQKQLEIKQNALQFLANEQNDQERRHAGQIEEIMKEVRELRGQLNGSIDNVGN